MANPTEKRKIQHFESTKRISSFFTAKNDPKIFLKIELNLENEFIIDFKTGLISLINSFQSLYNDSKVPPEL